MQPWNKFYRVEQTGMGVSLSHRALEVLSQRRRYLVTGVAGFIGSNTLEALLLTGNEVIGLDNMSSGNANNLDEVLKAVGAAASHFRFKEGDIRRMSDCREACVGVDVVIHLAARGSMPRSIVEPLDANENNVSGSLNMLVAARDAQVRQFVYSSSSSVYGDVDDLVKIEPRTGRQLSPCAVSKYAVELYARNFADLFDLHTVGLRYFNVFGPRQDPLGEYAAVIPIWIASMAQNKPCKIFGKGDTSRDFCYVNNVVLANVLASRADLPEIKGEVFNVATGNSTSLNQLFELLRSKLEATYPHLKNYRPQYCDYRVGDVKHSQGCIEKATRILEYHPTHTLEQGLDEALPWYIANLPMLTAAAQKG